VVERSDTTGITMSVMRMRIDPAGVAADLGHDPSGVAHVVLGARRTGGIAALDPRLLAGIPAGMGAGSLFTGDLPR
jgi:hypothetical protein